MINEFFQNYDDCLSNDFIYEYLSQELFINVGFFILSDRIFDYIEHGDELVERPFQRLIKEKKLLHINTRVSGLRWIRSKIRNALMKRMPGESGLGSSGEMAVLDLT